MTSAPSPHSTAPPVAEAVSTAWSPRLIRPIAVVVPDHLSAALLLEYAGPLFPAKVVPGGRSYVIRATTELAA